MPSSIAHALTATVIGTGILPRDTPRRIWVVGVLSAVALDIDAVGRPFHRGDIAWLGGHRAFTHSLFLAVVLGLLVASLIRSEARSTGYRIRVALFVMLATAAHGILDAFTTYGSGVKFLSPFSQERYRSAWRPITDLPTEVMWVWMPALGLLAVGAHLGRRARTAAEPDTP